MSLFANPRVGVVVPPENPTAEPEFHHLFGPTANVYTSRFPITPGMGLRDMLETYNEVLPDAVAAFGDLRPGAVVVACSASHYLLGPDGDREFCAALSAASGLAVRSSTQAILAACRALGTSRLTLVSPYRPWLTDLSRAFWEEAGLTVEDVVPVPAGEDAGGEPRFEPYAVRTETILRLLDAHAPAADTTLLFTGTGMGTVAALDALARAQPHRTLLTSNLASAWWAHRAVGAGTDGTHPQLRRLIDRTAPGAHPGDGAGTRLLRPMR